MTDFVPLPVTRGIGPYHLNRYRVHPERPCVLPADLRAAMEDSFRESFADVQIVLGPTAQILTSELGTVGCTDGQRLFFAPGCYRPDLFAGRLVIAHELAHVVQKRRGKLTRGSLPIIPDYVLENEANDAAGAALDGKSGIELTADPAPTLRGWGPAGHYYTSYFAALAAGFTEEAAARSAFFCQMPDQVSNFDATVAGEAWTVAAILPVLFGPAHVQNVTKHMPGMVDVQRGLHCLTGRASAEETKLRVQILKNLAKHAGSPTFGLALHALGDSFAHRRRDNQALMYQSPYGHFGADRKLGRDVDNINEHIRLYQSYASTLFETLLAIAQQHGLDPILDQATFTAAVNVFCMVSHEEDMQIKAIRSFCSHNLRTLNSYAPETAERQPIPWNQFFIRYTARYKINPRLLTEVQFRLTEWSKL